MVTPGRSDRHRRAVDEPGARRAAETAEILRRELTHAQVELHRFERARLQPVGGDDQARPGVIGRTTSSHRAASPRRTTSSGSQTDGTGPSVAAVASVLVPAASRRRRVRTLRAVGRRRGTGLAVWLMILYLLLTVLSLAPAHETGARPANGSAVVGHAEGPSGNPPAH